jgi:formate dehydrogenase subunit delta
MNLDKLIRMANRIGEFFAAMPERDEALEGIAGHIGRSWEPRMRRQLFAHVDETGGAGLSPIVLDALRAHAVDRP